jgi:hypothetical protein
LPPLILISMREESISAIFKLIASLLRNPQE